MKLAVTYNPENGEIFQHFGRTETFKVYDLADGKIQKAEVCSTQGQGHGALVGVLQQLGAEAVICGGIGGGAQEGLKKPALLSMEAAAARQTRRWKISWQTSSSIRKTSGAITTVNTTKAAVITEQRNRDLLHATGPLWYYEEKFLITILSTGGP